MSVYYMSPAHTQLLLISRVCVVVGGLKDGGRGGFLGSLICFSVVFFCNACGLDYSTSTIIEKKTLERFSAWCSA